MTTLKFKNNPCEEHLKVETSDDWCPYCLMAELETLRNLQTRVKNAFEQVDMSMHEGGLGATVEELVLRCVATSAERRLNCSTSTGELSRKKVRKDGES